LRDDAKSEPSGGCSGDGGGAHGMEKGEEKVMRKERRR
jgi:hypothetical protein